MITLPTRELLDSDGENRAVRSFLLLYGANQSVTTDQMRSQLEMSGFDGCWPDWAKKDMHLTKAGAQLWIRHLFALEGTASAKVSDDRVYFAVTRPEGYEDVDSDIILGDMFGINRGHWCVEILTVAPMPYDPNSNDVEGSYESS